MLKTYCKDKNYYSGKDLISINVLFISSISVKSVRSVSVIVKYTFVAKLNQVYISYDANNTLRKKDA